MASRRSALNTSRSRSSRARMEPRGSVGPLGGDSRTERPATALGTPWNSASAAWRGAKAQRD
eukprot:216708-Lingulodinium_polyedra.AAC.1